MFRRKSLLLQASATAGGDPFRVLELKRSCTKKEVKEKYRQLAKVHHPDSTGGDARKMEEINRAYNQLIKEGGYEKLHVPETASSDSRARAERLAKLDPETERARPEGGFTYQNRETGRWESTDESIRKESGPRYASFGGNQPGADLHEAIKKHQMAQQRREENRTWYEKGIIHMSSSLPTDNPFFVFLTVIMYIVGLYYGYIHVVSYWYKMDMKKEYYEGVREKRERVEEVYPFFREEMHCTATIAAAVLLAAALKKNGTEPIRPPSPDPMAAKPTPEHFLLHGGA